jgi:hypothetical protein
VANNTVAALDFTLDQVLTPLSTTAFLHPFNARRMLQHDATPVAPLR